MSMSDSIYRHIIAITNRLLSRRPFDVQIERICRLHPHALILREKDLSGEAYQTLAEKVLTICAGYNVPCILHQFTQAAQNLGVRKIHLPLRQLEEEHVKLKSGAFELVGVSVHSVEDALRAQKAGASYVTAGHIFATDCKAGLPPRGTDFLKEVCSAVQIPVYAIGGIRPEEKQIEKVLSCGAAGACIMSGMMEC